MISSLAVDLATYFSFGEAARFKQWLYDEYGITFSVVKDDRLSDGHKYYLRANHENSLAFCDLIAPVAPVSMAAKLAPYYQFLSGEKLQSVGVCSGCKVELFDLRRVGLCQNCYYRFKYSDADKEAKAVRQREANDYYIKQIEKKLPKGTALHLNRHTVRVELAGTSFHVRADKMGLFASINIEKPSERLRSKVSDMDVSHSYKFKKQYNSKVVVVYKVRSSVFLDLVQHS